MTVISSRGNWLKSFCEKNELREKRVLNQTFVFILMKDKSKKKKKENRRANWLPEK